MSHRSLCRKERFADLSKLTEWQDSGVGLLRSVKVGYVILIVEIKNKKGYYGRETTHFGLFCSKLVYFGQKSEKLD